VILTAVDRVCINWGKPNQTSLDSMTIAEAEQYCAEGHFAPGSMLPKVMAGIKFANSGRHKKAIITSLDKAIEALEGRTGTTICAY
jgi:carbamate kinase